MDILEWIGPALVTYWGWEEGALKGEHALKAFCYMEGDARKGVDHMVGATRARADTEYQDEAKGAD